jgi:DNA-binding transcriptional ArsR family regulator
VRLELLNHLHVHGEMNVQDLTAATNQHQANVSKHLRILAEEGVVERRRDGLYSYYRIADPIVSALCVIVCSRMRDEELASVQPGATWRGRCHAWQTKNRE